MLFHNSWWHITKHDNATFAGACTTQPCYFLHLENKIWRAGASPQHSCASVSCRFVLDLPNFNKKKCAASWNLLVSLWNYQRFKVGRQHMFNKMPSVVDQSLLCSRCGLRWDGCICHQMAAGWVLSSGILWALCRPPGQFVMLSIVPVWKLTRTWRQDLTVFGFHKKPSLVWAFLDQGGGAWKPLTVHLRMDYTIALIDMVMLDCMLYVSEQCNTFLWEDSQTFHWTLRTFAKHCTACIWSWRETVTSAASCIYTLQPVCAKAQRINTTWVSSEPAPTREPLFYPHPEPSYYTFKLPQSWRVSVNTTRAPTSSPLPV